MYTKHLSKQLSSYSVRWILKGKCLPLQKCCFCSSRYICIFVDFSFSHFVSHLWTFLASHACINNGHLWKKHRPASLVFVQSDSYLQDKLDTLNNVFNADALCNHKHETGVEHNPPDGCCGRSKYTSSQRHFSLNQQGTDVSEASRTNRCQSSLFLMLC